VQANSEAKGYIAAKAMAWLRVLVGWLDFDSNGLP